MDLQRILLIGAAALLSFMLLTEWVAFKDEKTREAAPVTERIIDNAGDTPTAAPTTADNELPETSRLQPVW